MEEHRLKVCTEYDDKKIFGPESKDEMTGLVMRMTEKKNTLKVFGGGVSRMQVSWKT